MSDRHLSLRREEWLGANECTLIGMRPPCPAHVDSDAVLICRSASAGNDTEVSA